jgi:PAS domain S-box-containing protein
VEPKDNRNKKIRVLCLEDSPQDVEIMREMIKDAGYDLNMDCTAAEKEFVSFLRGSTYDIILSDFKLPGFDGFTALRWAMEICPKVPFISVSGTIGEEAAVELLKQGAVDYVLKAKLERLPFAIKRALDEAKEKELRQRAEAAVRESELKLRTVADFTYDWEYWEKENQEIAYISPSCERITGYSREEFMADPSLFEKIVHPEDVDHVKRSRERVFTTEHKHDVDELEFRIIHKNGSVVHIYHVCRPIFDVSDKYHGKRISNRDITDRKRAEEEIEALSRFPKENPNPVLRVERDGKLLYANPASETLLRRWNCSVGEYLPPDWKERVAKVVEQNTRTSMDVECGNIFYSVMISPILKGNYVNIYARDITERKQTEEELRESENRYRSVLQSATDAIVTVDSSGMIIGWNSASERIFGYSYTEAVGQPLTSIISLYPFDEHTNGMKSIQSEGGQNVIGKTVEFKGFRKDKSVFPIELSLSAWETKSEQFFTCIIRDITERKQAEEALRESEERMKDIVYSMGDWVWEVDVNGRYTYSSNKGRDIFGCAQEDIIGKTPFDFMSPEEMARVKTIFSEIVSNKAPIKDLENWNIRKDGKRFCLLTNGVPILDENGILRGYRGVDKDITERKRAEEELRESEEKFKAIYQNSNDAIMLLNKNGFFDCNLQTLKMFKIKKEEEFIKFRPDELSPPVQPDGKNSFEAAQENISIAYRDGYNHFDWVHRRFDGEDFYAEVLLTTFNIGGEQVLQATVRDITERKLAEEELKESEEKYRGIFENVQDVYYETLFDGTILEASPSVEFISKGQYHRTDLIGKSMYEFYADTKDRDTLIEAMQKTGSVTDFEVRLKNRDGSFISCSISSKINLDAQGQPEKIIGSMHDISERKRAEKELQEALKFNEQIILCAQQGIIIYDFDLRYLVWNPFMEQLTGFPASKVLGKHPWEVFPFLQKVGVIERLEKALVGEPTDKNDFPYQIQGSGKSGWASDSSAPFRNANGKIIGVIGMVSDITEQKQMEEGLRQMQKLEGLGTLAGGIAHDFNNILGIILAYITSTHRFKDDTKKLDLAVNTIVKAVERGKTLVQQILMFARKTETAFGAVDVNDIVMEIMTMIMETFPKVLTYSQNFDKAVPYINADRSQLHQVLMNLCVNARDAMPKGGLLTINTRMVSVVSLRHQHPDAAASGYVCIEVSDTGEGMTEETRKRIFEPFFTTKGIGKGTGLGLSVVFGIVQTHKGFIDVESELGKGTTFRLYLPASQVAAPISVKDEETLEEISGGTETLLVVEDEEMLMMSLRIVLVEKGYTVLSAGDGLMALKIYQERKNDIALVLTDLGLPNMTGMEVCQRIKTIKPNEHIILATGYLDPEMKSEFLKTGIQNFLFKPYDLKQVLKEVREVLDEKS